MESQEELTYLTTGSKGLTPARIGAVGLPASPVTLTQTYSTADGTLVTPTYVAPVIPGADYASEASQINTGFSTLEADVEDLRQFVNKIADILQANGLAA